MAGITVFAAGMFLAAWSTYGFETAVCYTGEFKNPKTDTFKAIFYSGLLCVVVYTLVPFAFQGYLGSGASCIPPCSMPPAGDHAGGVRRHAGAAKSTAAWASPPSWRGWCTRVNSSASSS